MGGDAQKSYRICYILSASLIVYTQVVFGAVYLFHGLYMFYARRKNKTFTLWQIASSFIVIFILSSPCLYQLSILASKRYIMAYAGSPTALDLLSALLPQHELVILLFSVVVACILMQSRKLTPHFYRLPYGIFVLLWYVVPLLSVFCFSVVSGNSIFDARYYFWFSPALALLITHVLDAFQSRYLRLTAAC